MTLTLGDLANVIDTIAPFHTACDWDNVGLLVGDAGRKVTKTLFALDATADVAREATRLKANVIVSHHPPFFDPMKRFDLSKTPGSILAELIQNDIGLIVAHTNLDVSPDGTNKALAELLDIESLEPLFSQPFEESHYKFVVYVPVGYEMKIIEAINRGGGGVIGKYSHCTFRTVGTGTFLPHEGAKPFLGKKGELEEAKECRMETIVPQGLMDTLLKEVVKAHPYEEVAYDIYPLKIKSEIGGLGMKGRLSRSMTVEKFAEKAKTVLKSQSVDSIRGKKRAIKKIALCSGAADRVVEACFPGEVDALLCGELKYHSMLEARHRGMSVIAAGHHETEMPGMRRLARLVGNHPRIKNESSFTLCLSKTDRTPVKRV